MPNTSWAVYPSTVDVYDSYGYIYQFNYEDSMWLNLAFGTYALIDSSHIRYDTGIPMCPIVIIRSFAVKILFDGVSCWQV